VASNAIDPAVRYISSSLKAGIKRMPLPLGLEITNPFYKNIKITVD
jgi:hypothetical protein